MQHDWSTNPVRDIPCLHQSFPKPPKALLKPPKPSKALQIFTVAAKASRNLSKHPKIFQSLPKPSQSLPKPSEAFWSIPKPPKACQSLPETARAFQTLPEPRWETYYVTKPPKAFRTLSRLPNKASQSLTKPCKAGRAFQSLPELPKAWQYLPKPHKSLTKPQGARTNGKSTEKHETFVPSMHFWTRKYNIPINGGQQAVTKHRKNTTFP